MLVRTNRVSDSNTLSPSLSQLTQLVDRRLAITRIGLAEVRRHLAEGQTGEAEIVLDKIDEDLDLLRCRVRREVERLAPRSSDVYGCAN
jgi:hypothetical protein